MVLVPVPKVRQEGFGFRTARVVRDDSSPSPKTSLGLSDLP